MWQILKTWSLKGFIRFFKIVKLKITKKVEKSSWQINLIMITYILSIQKVSKDNDIRIEEAISVKDKY